jgi:uncharacterized protein (TIGR02145 family)
MTPQIPNYEIKRVLGEGGMAVVYLAEHNLLHNQVAIKVLNEEFVRNKNIRARFLTEARSMARMSHPQIIKVTDLIDDGDTVAFVMEYIEGETLKDYLDKKGKLTTEEIGGLLEQMLWALEYAHEQGLVHRDIKPSNFMVNPKGRLKLLDFGIAKQTNTASAEYTITGTNQRMGTAMYMSPEQIHETRSVTPRSDIYSLGVVLWQMVTGKKPYSTETLSAFQLQTKIVNEPLPLTNSVWDEIIRRATEKEVEKRFRDAKEFKDALKGAEKSNAQESTRIEDKTVLESKGSFQITSSLTQGSAATTKKNNTIGFIIGMVLILGLGYLIWNGNSGTKNIIKENESIGSSIKIGNQIWQAENLNVDRFRNGDPIPEVISAEEWVAAGKRGEPAWCYYNNDPVNGKIYGKLYNWYAVNDLRGLAPEGWHIPTDEEWTILIDYLGGWQVAGGKMKSVGTAYWNSPNRGATNKSGFSALPGGYRDEEARRFFNVRYNVFFWSASERGNSSAWNRHMDNDYRYVKKFHFYGYFKQNGFSVRCLKD